MTTANQDAHDLFSAAFGGVIFEDVLAAIQDISRIPLPFSDSIPSQGTSNHYTEWTKDKLRAPDTDNAVIDGADASGNGTQETSRVGNHHQIMDEVVRVSDRAEAVDFIGASSTLGYQLMQRQNEVLRDYNAIMLTQQASVRGTDTVAGRLGGLGAWLETNTSRGGTGADGGFNFTTGLVDAPTVGTARALSETMIKDVLQSIYEQGGNVTIGLSRPSVIRKWSEFQFTDQARIANLQRDRGEAGPAQAQGTVNVYYADFGQVVEMRADRTQEQETGGRTNLYLYDPSRLARGILIGPRAKPLGATGLSEMRQLYMDATLIVHSEEAHGVVADIDETQDMVA